LALVGLQLTLRDVPFQTVRTLIRRLAPRALTSLKHVRRIPRIAQRADITLEAPLRLFRVD
jgi:hypothetical protein